MSLTTDRNHPGLNEVRADGQNEAYIILSEEERAKGFVRPVRDAYVHVGKKPPAYPLRDLTKEEQERTKGQDYTKYEEYPEGSPEKERGATGRYWTDKQLKAVNDGCGTKTFMPIPIAETYARQPAFYGSTYCAGCKVHLPVGEGGEFVWAGTDIRVGT